MVPHRGPMTPPPTQTLSLLVPDGRTVTAQVAGPPDGRVVLLLTPAPGSRRFDPDPQVTAAAGIRLVTVDRPGYGASDPLRGLTVATAADDAAAVLDALGVCDAGVVGWSAGGRVAAALAARRPELVSALAVVATPAPDEQVPWVPEEQRGLIAHLRSDPTTAYDALLGMLGPMTADAADPSMVAAGPADEVLLEDAPVRQRVVDMLAEAFRQGPAGLAADLLSYTVHDPELGPVRAPTTCWYGAEDAQLSVEHGRWWSDRLGGRLEVVEAAGHLVLVPAWQRVLDGLGG